MHPNVMIGPGDGVGGDRARRGRIGVRVACRATIVLALACTSLRVGQAAEDLARRAAPSARLAEIVGLVASFGGNLVVGLLAWATLRRLAEAKDGGAVRADATRVAPRPDPCPAGASGPDRDVGPLAALAECGGGEDAHFWSVLERSRVVAYMKDGLGRYLRVNRRWASLFDPEGRGIIGKDDFALFPEELAAAFARNDRMVCEAGITVELEEVAPHPDGPHTYLSIKVPVFDVDGNPSGICGISFDITERKELERRLAEQLELARATNAELGRRGAELAEANARLAELATTDGLTSLMNRRHFDEVIESGVRTSSREGTPLSVLMLDLDGFKSYNDAFGHPAGDRVLQRVAAILRDHVRARDEVARYGGEEFIAMLPQADEAVARAIAERLRVAIEAWCWPCRPLTASIGIATFAGGPGGAQALIDRADQALYRSKAAGRNRVTHHDDLALAAGTIGPGPWGEGSGGVAGAGAGR